MIEWAKLCLKSVDSNLCYEHHLPQYKADTPSRPNPRLQENVQVLPCKKPWLHPIDPSSGDWRAEHEKSA